jgi:glycosyltransferase involved in cell wall biosynthesis
MVIAGNGKPSQASLRAMIADDLMPDVVSAEERLGATHIDDRYFATVPGLRGALLRKLPLALAQSLVILTAGRRYDAVLTWSDKPSLLTAAIMRPWRRRPAHVAILMWPSRPKKARPLALLHRGMDRIIACAPLQRRYLQDRIGVEPKRLVPTRARVDLKFWRPIEAETDTICSVGQEMRDYATLIEALRPLAVPCHLAVGSTVFGQSNNRWWRDQIDEQQLPDRLTVGHLPLAELRALYARSRFVVVPLEPSDNDSGINTIVEACAMGKAIICTASPGQVDLLEDGVNCVRVPPHDPDAMRRAIEQLWSDPDRCLALGAAGREIVQAGHGMDAWAATLDRAVREAVAVRAAAGRRRRGAAAQEDIAV